MKDIIVIVAHEMHKSISEKYFRIKEGFRKYGDVVLLLNHEMKVKFIFQKVWTIAYLLQICSMNWNMNR